MNCQAIENGDIVEKYAAGQLSEPERSEFEEHYFVCQKCLDDLRVWQTVRKTVPLAERRPARPQIFWLGAVAASILVLLSVSLALRSGRKPVETVPPTASLPSASLRLLAQVEAPRYDPSVLRGSEDAPERQFRDAMQSYARREYAATAEALKTVLAGNPKAAAARFYLGVCDLLRGSVPEAVAELRRVDGLGATLYQEEARFFLAKALLAQEDGDGAARALEATIQLAGDREQESRALLARLHSIQHR